MVLVWGLGFFVLKYVLGVRKKKQHEKETIKIKCEK